MESVGCPCCDQRVVRLDFTVRGFALQLLWAFLFDRHLKFFIGPHPVLSAPEEWRLVAGNRRVRKACLGPWDEKRRGPSESAID
jgi:hypothetical protein